MECVLQRSDTRDPGAVSLFPRSVDLCCDQRGDFDSAWDSGKLLDLFLDLRPWAFDSIDRPIVLGRVRACTGVWAGGGDCVPGVGPL